MYGHESTPCPAPSLTWLVGYVPELNLTKSLQPDLLNILGHHLLLTHGAAHTCVEAYELEEGYVGMSQHFALLRPGGCAAHFQPNNPIFDRGWRDKCACRIPGQGGIVFWVYEMGDVLLTAHLHLHNVTV